MQSITPESSVSHRLFSCGFAGFLFFTASFDIFAASREEAFDSGNVSGNIRAHYNERHYSTRPDATAFALGGALRAETGPIGWSRIGIGFYTAQDVGTNRDDPTRIDSRMGSDVEVLGEAYVSASAWDSVITVGRQRITTPFANPIDVFIVPFTFEGVSVKNTTFSNLTLEFNLLNTIKSAGSDEFVDVGVWSTRRFGINETKTSGTWMLGGTYKQDNWQGHAWLYRFSDLFTSQYLQGDFAFSPFGNFTPFVSAQIIRQRETGDALLGRVDSSLYGLQGGVSTDRAKFILGYTNIKERPDTFNNGAFLAPYNFSTSPFYTNSMLTNMENNDAGTGIKLTLLYSFPSVEIKLSHAGLNFVNTSDLGATDFDVTYKMDRFIEGLSLRYRVEIVTSDSDAAEQSDHRLQLQYLF